MIYFTSDWHIFWSNVKIQDKIKEYQQKNPQINGIRHTVTEWAKIYNINAATVRARLKNFDINIQQALTATKQELKLFKRR